MGLRGEAQENWLVAVIRRKVMLKESFCRRRNSNISLLPSLKDQHVVTFSSPVSAMETLSSSASILSSSSSSISFFSPKRKDPLTRHLRFHTSSKKNGKDSDSDLRSDSSDTSIVPCFNNPTLSKDAAMGLVLSAASVGGWTTGSGMEGPPAPAGSEDGSNTEKVSTLPWSLFTKSPRRRMRVAFTCNVCGQRTTRAINPHAYTDGTVFVQCCGCNVFHKLVDNLNLFHEMKCYVSPSFNYTGEPNWDVGFKLFDLDDNDDGGDEFPV